MIKHVTLGYYENIPELIDVIKSIYRSTLDKNDWSRKYAQCINKTCTYEREQFKVMHLL